MFDELAEQFKILKYIASTSKANLAGIYIWIIKKGNIVQFVEASFLDAVFKDEWYLGEKDVAKIEISEMAGCWPTIQKYFTPLEPT